MKIYEFQDQNTMWLRLAWVLANSEEEAREYLKTGRGNYIREYGRIVEDRESKARWEIENTYSIDNPGYLFDFEE